MYDYMKIVNNNLPVAEIEAVFDFIKNACPERKGRLGQKFYLEQNNRKMCFVLYSGTCIIRRTKDSLVLSTIKAPNIVGLYDYYHEKTEVHVIASSDIKFRYLSVDELFQYADENNLWKNLSQLLLLSAARFSDYQKETVGISTYELICNLLTSLEKESFHIRATTTALEYIQERCILSRSGIMKTLSTLKAGGYINIRNGLLIQINSLPKKF